MATVQINFGIAMHSGAPVPNAVPEAKQTITSSATNQVSTAVAKSGNVVTIKSIGGAVWVAVGQSPVASAGTDWHVSDGEYIHLGSISPGDKVAVIDA